MKFLIRLFSHPVLWMTAVAPAAAPLPPSRLPLIFEANVGQAGAETRFLSRGSGYTLLLTTEGAKLTLWKPSGAAPSAYDLLSMIPAGANRGAKVTGLDQLSTRSHYFAGNQSRQWRTDIPNYAKVKYEEVYPGIDLVFYGSGRQLEYDFVVAPGADPRAIQLSLHAQHSGAVRIDAAGDLVIRTAGGEVRLLKPVVYQADASGERHFVDGRFVLLARDRVGFRVAAYDRRRPLIIDPVLSYATYLGSGNLDFAGDVAVDSAGNAYLTGATCVPGQDRFFCDATVTKINSTGTAVLYNTALAGAGHTEQGRALEVDAAGNAYVTGSTCAPDFPVTNGAFQTTLRGRCDAFVAKLDTAGKVLYSTYLGGSLSPGNPPDQQGSDQALEIAIDSAGDAYVVGQTCSSDFPVKNGFESQFRGHNCDGFISKIHPAGSGASDLLYSSYLSASTEFGEATGIAVDSNHLAYVIGETGSSDFPTTAGAFQRTFAGDVDQVILKLDMTKSGTASLLYSTFLGGTGLDGLNRGRIAVDASGIIYVSGDTTSRNFPTTTGAFQTVFKPSADPLPDNSVNTFAAKLNPAGQGASDLLYSTLLGVTGRESAEALALMPPGDFVIAGETPSGNFPVTADAFQSSLLGTSDGFVVRLHPGGHGTSDLVYSTLLGGAGNETPFGVAVDSTQHIYVAGSTDSVNFPHSTDAIHKTFGGGTSDPFVARLPNGNFSIAPVAAITAELGGTGKANLSVSAIGAFDDPVTLGLSGQPAGVTASFSPASVTPGASPASSNLTLNPVLFTPAGTFHLNVAGVSGMVTHSVPLQLTVHASAGGAGTVVGGLTDAGCIDNGGISGSLLGKLNDAQAEIDAGKIQGAINTLNALLNQLQAQSGKHITTSCTVNGQTFNAADLLIQDVRAILASLQP